MVVAFLSTATSLTTDQYDRVMTQLEASGAGAPPGRRFHACFGPADHLTVFDVWDSAEEFQAFAMKLRPILATEHIEMAAADPLEMHRLIEGGEASVLRKTIDELRNKAFFIRPVEKLRDKLHQTKEKSSQEHKPSGSATT